MRYLPIRFHVFFILTTLLFSFFGPRVYTDYYKVPVVMFMSVYLMVVLFGYYLGVNGTVKTRNIYKPRIMGITVERLLKLSIASCVILYAVNIAYLIANGRMSFSLTSIGANYGGFYEYYKDKTGDTLITFELVFLVLSALPKFVSLSLGFLYYKTMGRAYKVLFIFFILQIVLTQTLSLGNQKSIGDIVIFAVIALVIRARRMTKPRRRALIRKGMLIMVTLFFLLSYMQYTRISSRDITPGDLNYLMADYTSYDFSHPIFQILGLELGLGVSAFITGYLSGGYYGLSLCLELPFVWTYGVGNSVALSTLTEHFSGINIYDNTFLARMEQTYGVLGKQHWHTIFPWLAGDLTFIGAVLIFFPIGYLYGKTWQEAIVFSNPISIMLFSVLSVLFIFVPANNQIMHGFDYLLVTTAIFFLWAVFGRKFNSLPAGQ